jgi:hypothetical protein
MRTFVPSAPFYFHGKAYFLPVPIIAGLQDLNMYLTLDLQALNILFSPFPPFEKGKEEEKQTTLMRAEKVTSVWRFSY